WWILRSAYCNPARAAAWTPSPIPVTTPALLVTPCAAAAPAMPAPAEVVSVAIDVHPDRTAAMQIYAGVSDRHGRFVMFRHNARFAGRFPHEAQCRGHDACPPPIDRQLARHVVRQPTHPLLGKTL